MGKKEKVGGKGGGGGGCKIKIKTGPKFKSVVVVFCVAVSL